MTDAIHILHGESAGGSLKIFAGWLATVLLAMDSLARVDLVYVEQIDKPKGPYRVPALGVINPEELAQAPPPVPLSAADLHSMAKAWRAWASPTPGPLLDYMDAREVPSPARRALAPLLYRYPGVGSGLNRWEFSALGHIADYQPELVSAVGHTMADAFHDGTTIGDGWLFWRLRRLASRALPHPLLELDPADGFELRGRSVKLTPAGEAVLAGEANALELNGLDDQVGGVILRYPGGPVWARRQGALVRTPGPAEGGDADNSTFLVPSS